MILPAFRRPRLSRDRRASVAVYIAMLAPVLAGSMALGIEVTSWSGAQVDMQRTADASARAGAIYCYNYATANSGSTCLSNATAAQTAATLAARLAEVNGITGATSPTWNATSKTYTDNNITAQIVSGREVGFGRGRPGQRAGGGPADGLAGLHSTQSVTVSATSTSEVISAPALRPAPADSLASWPCSRVRQYVRDHANGSITVTPRAAPWCRTAASTTAAAAASPLPGSMPSARSHRAVIPR